MLTRIIISFTLLGVLPWTVSAAVAAKPASAKNTRKAAAVASEPPGTVGEPGKKFVCKHSGGAPRELEVYFPSDWRASGRGTLAPLNSGEKLVRSP